MWWVNGRGGWTTDGPRDPPALRWPDAPARTDPTKGVYAAHGLLTNLCMVIHTLTTARGEAPANMVVVRLAHGIAADGRHGTPGKFTSDQYNHFLKMLGGALLPKAEAKRSTRRTSPASSQASTSSTPGAAGLTDSARKPDAGGQFALRTPAAVAE